MGEEIEEEEEYALTQNCITQLLPYMELYRGTDCVVCGYDSM